MRLSTILATTIVAVSASPVADVQAPGVWTISDFSFCRGDNTYDYSFDIKGTRNGKTPAFAGTCAGTNGKVYLECTYDPKPIKDFNLFAKTEIKNGKPELNIMTWYIAGGCRFTGKGGIIIDDDTCESKTGDKYRIEPADSRECN